MSEITVFTARAIHTMEPSLPQGTAIAVRDGQVLEVGTLDSLKPWLDRHPHNIDDSFADKVIMHHRAGMGSAMGKSARHQNP